MTVADELRVESRRAPRMPWDIRWRMRRTHDPSCLCRGGNGRSRNPQHKAGDTGPLRGERQLAARDEIELLRLAPDFQHHDAGCITSERVGGTTQGVLDIGRAHRHKMTRIKTEFGQSAHRQRAHFAL